MVVRAQNEDSSHRELTAALRRRNVTFHHLHEALLTIEPELTRLATDRADNADIALLHENLRAQQRNLENFKEWNRLDEEFHLTIAEMSGNPALIITRTPITKLLLPVLNRFIRSPVDSRATPCATTTGSSRRWRRATPSWPRRSRAGTSTTSAWRGRRPVSTSI